MESASCTKFRRGIAKHLDTVLDRSEPFQIKRRFEPDVVILSQKEYARMMSGFEPNRPEDQTQID